VVSEEIGLGEVFRGIEALARDMEQLGVGMKVEASVTILSLLDVDVEPLEEEAERCG